MKTSYTVSNDVRQRQNCEGITHNWYIGYMIRSSFWKFQPIFFEKRLKLLDDYYLIFCNLEKREVQRLVYLQAKFQLIRCINKKKFLASPQRDRFPVETCRAVSCRAGPCLVANLNRVPYTLKTHQALQLLLGTCTDIGWSELVGEDFVK